MLLSLKIGLHVKHLYLHRHSCNCFKLIFIIFQDRVKDDWLANKMLRDAFRAGKKERKAQLAKAGQCFAMKWKIGVLSRK